MSWDVWPHRDVIADTLRLPSVPLAALAMMKIAAFATLLSAAAAAVHPAFEYSNGCAYMQHMLTSHLRISAHRAPASNDDEAGTAQWLRRLVYSRVPASLIALLTARHPEDRRWLPSRRRRCPFLHRCLR